MNARCLCFLLIVLNAVDSLQEVKLPRIDFYMLCTNDVQNMSGVLELDGFYTDLLGSASVISVEEDPPDAPEFFECNSNANRTQVKFTINGVAEFSDENVLTELEIQKLVTVENLQKYIEAEYRTCDIFEAIISPAGTEFGGGQHSNIALMQLACDLNISATLAAGLAAASVASIVASIICCCCIFGFIAVCCCGIC